MYFGLLAEIIFGIILLVFKKNTNYFSTTLKLIMYITFNTYLHNIT